MVNTMQQEMKHKEERLIREIFIDMEQEPMNSILQQGPDEVPSEEA